MKVDNSGPAVVFTEKTKQAIEEGKNRVTLLQVEELRLNKLKKQTEAEIITVEAALEYKTKLLKDTEEFLTKIEKDVQIALINLNASASKYATVVKETDLLLVDVQTKQTQIHEKTLELNKREKQLDEREAKVLERENLATATLENAETKKSKIDEFFKTL